jgi:hypothetical protein
MKTSKHIVTSYNAVENMGWAKNYIFAGDDARKRFGS